MDDGDDPQPTKIHRMPIAARVVISRSSPCRRPRISGVHDERRGEQMQPEGDVGPPGPALGVGHIEAHRQGEYGEAADQQQDVEPRLGDGGDEGRRDGDRQQAQHRRTGGDGDRHMEAEVMHRRQRHRRDRRDRDRRGVRRRGEPEAPG